MSDSTDPGCLRLLRRAAWAAAGYAEAGSSTEAAEYAEVLTEALEPLGITPGRVASAYTVQPGQGDAPAVVRTRPGVSADPAGNPVAAWPWRPADGLEDQAARLLALVVALEAGEHQGPERGHAVAYLQRSGAALKRGADARLSHKEGHQEGRDKGWDEAQGTLREARATGGRNAAAARRKLPDATTLRQERDALIQAGTRPHNVAAKLAQRYGVTPRAVRDALKARKAEAR